MEESAMESESGGDAERVGRGGAVAGPGGRLREKLSAGSGGTFYADLACGSLRVESHDAPEVEVDAETESWGDGDVVFTLWREGADVVLEGEGERWMSRMLCGRRTRVRVRIPRDWSIDVRTGGGRIRARAIGGRLAAETSGGEIDVRGARGPVLLRSAGGPLWAEDVDGDLSATTSGGAIGVRAPGASVDADTSGGPIDVSLRRDAGAELDAATSGGWVRVEAPLAETSTCTRTRVIGRIGGGGPLLRLRTSGGWIRVRGGG
jgi:hypothetical protein